MSQALTPAVGSKVGRLSLAAELSDVLSAPSYLGRGDDGHLARVLVVPRGGSDADAVQRAAAPAKSLTSPNVLKFADADMVDGRLAVSFDHVEGAPLLSLITSAGSQGLARGVSVRIVLDLLEGLAAAHAAGLAHGELGPHLVIVGTDGRARVLGLGIAKLLGKSLAPKTASDRLAYIAPERVKTAASGVAPVADPKCDVFSVAVILWELLAKQRLFAGRLESAVIQKVLTAPVPPLAATSDDIPDAVDDALKKALERDPSRRTASAKELAQAIEAALGEPAASHEDVGRAVEELAKSALEDLRKSVSEAGAVSSVAASEAVPPPRASFPTLDDSWVMEAETSSAPPPPPRPPTAKPVPPKPPPAPPPRAITAKPAETKPADAKAADAKPAEAKAADAKPAEDKPADAGASVDVTFEASVGEVSIEDAKGDEPADDKAPASKPGTKSPAVKALPGKPLLSKPVVSSVPKVPAAATPAAKKAIALPRKGTLIGIVPPKPEAAGAKGDAAKTDAASSETSAQRSTVDISNEVTAPPNTAAGEALKSESDASKAEPDAPKTEAAAPKTEAAAPKTEAAPAEAAGPNSAPVSAAPRSTDGEGVPSSASPMSLLDRKRRALPGNLKPGDALGRYELLMPVATGGMATVWAARLQGTAGFQKTVAIKTMLPGMSADADFEEMFLDEARVAARIRHPNVVEIFDLGEEGETLYLVMEWVDGETLGALQKSSKAHGGVPLPILLRLASQACAGLHAAHELRDDKGALVDLVHRDISPANILVSKTGFVKIVDFGVAKSKARMYTTRVGGIIKGKTPYLSPEQLSGQAIDRRSDLFSFGAVLYVLATGLHPFRGETEGKTIENIALRDPVSLRKLDPSIHPELEAIVLKALHKDREKRFETASEMQRAIDTLAASIGQTVNDDDVAAFVRLVAGPGLEKRSNALREAISAADAGKQPIQPRHGAEAKTDTPASGVPKAEAGGEGEDIVIEAEASPPKPPQREPVATPASGMPALKKPEAADVPLTAPSLGSDAEPASPPDTLAAASTEPSLPDGEITPPRRRGPMLIVGGILGACALIGILAVAGSGGDKPTPSGKPVAASTGSEGVRTGQAATPPPVTATAEPSATATAEPAATATAEPSATATAEPAATAEPSATATAEPVASAEPSQVTTRPFTGKRPPVTVKTPPTSKTVKPPPIKTSKPYNPALP